MDNDARKRGVKKVGVGSYGCVYRPPLKCRGRAPLSGNYITKLMDDNDADIESDKMSIIDAIDPAGVFHYPLADSCQTDFVPMNCEECEDDSCRETCCHIEGSSLLSYEDGGVDLETYTRRPVDVKRYFLGLWRLFYGLYMMHSNHFYHFDIKPSNIVVKETPAETIIKFIDFGLSRTNTEMEERLKTSSLDYMFKNYNYYPADTVLITRRHKVSSDRDEFFAFYKKKMTEALSKRMTALHGSVIWPNQSSTSTGYNATSKKVLNQLDRIFNKLSLDGMFYDSYFRIWNIYRRVDVYSLGLALNMSLKNVSKFSTMTPTDMVFSGRLIALTHKMFEQNILERIDPLTAYREYTALAKEVYNVDMSEKY